MWQQLLHCPLFKGITDKELENLLQDIPYQIKSFTTDRLIASRGDALSNLLIVLEGSVRGEMLDLSGKILKVEDIVAPQAIASAFIFGQQNHFPVDVIANKDTTLFYLPVSTLVTLFTKNERFLQNYLNAISNRAQFLSQRLWFLSFKTIKGKLAQYILNHSGEKEQLSLPMTQQKLSEFFGVTRPSLARALGEMQKDKILQVNRREITILNRQKLLDIIE